MPISAVDSIPLAFRHTVEQAFKPFRFGQWNRLALVGLLAGELGSGSCNMSRSFSNPGAGTGGALPHLPTLSQLGINPAALVGLIVTLVVSAFVLGLILMYISSVMRFILFDSVLARDCRVGQYWGRRQSEGLGYFLFKLAYMFISLAGIGILIGIPAALALSAGWFHDPKSHIGPLIIFALLAALAIGLFAIIMLVVYVLTKDFVIPQMALEGIGVVESWRRLWALMKAEKGSYAGYIGMKVVLAIAAAIAVGIVTMILALVIAVPAIAMTVIAIMTGKSAGLTWNVYTITLAVVVGAILVAVFLYLVSLVSVPVIVFFPAYSIYFFAGRYPRLAQVLYPSAAVQPIRDVPPAPPLPPNPAPIG